MRGVARVVVADGALRCSLSRRDRVLVQRRLEGVAMHSRCTGGAGRSGGERRSVGCVGGTTAARVDDDEALFYEITKQNEIHA